LARQLRPGSPLLAELDEPAPGCRTKFVSVWTPGDQVVVPQRNARLSHPDLDVEEHCLRDVGHWALPVDSRASRLVVNSLVRVHATPAERATSEYDPRHAVPITHSHSATSELSS
jgi:hypothetical protein